METIGASELNQRLDELLDRTVHGETFEITKDGKMVGRLVPPARVYDQDEAKAAADHLIAMAGMGGRMSADELKAMIHEGHKY